LLLLLFLLFLYLWLTVWLFDWLLSHYSPNFVCFRGKTNWISIPHSASGSSESKFFSHFFIKRLTLQWRTHS
jgi:hypothetical protein